MILVMLEYVHITNQWRVELIVALLFLFMLLKDAIRALDNYEFEGRRLVVQEAREPGAKRPPPCMSSYHVILPHHHRCESYL
jgi:hypothetical protein